MSKCKTLFAAKNFSANASIESWSIKSITSTCTPAIPARFFFAFSIFLAGTITVAPAAARAFTVSEPIPV